MIRPYFKDSGLEQAFFENGYMVIPFLETEELIQLKELYNQYMPNETEGLYASSLFNSAEVNRKVNQTICNIMQSATRRYCEAGKLLGGSFLVKSPVNTSNLPLHQDWNIVDEQVFASAMLWCPLQDTDESNGTMYVLPNSHRFFVNFRSGAMPSKRILVTEDLLPFLKTINVKAGEALVYHPALFHGSHPNRSDKLRIVAAGSTVHADATLLYYHLNSENKAIEVYRAAEDFYLNEIHLLELGKIPENTELLQTFQAENPSPDAEDLLIKLNPNYKKMVKQEIPISRQYPGSGKRFWSKLQNFFKLN